MSPHLNVVSCHRSAPTVTFGTENSAVRDHLTISWVAPGSMAWEPVVHDASFLGPASSRTAPLGQRGTVAGAEGS